MKRIVPVLIILLLSYIAVRPILTPAYFPMHDDTQVSRVIEMGWALKEGQFPVRWVSDLGYGYGYPLYNFYAPLPYYVGGVLYAMGVSALTATKIMFGLGIVLPGILLYMTTVELLGWPAALVATALYTLSPYHAVQVYVRGAVGEYWELVFWPLILYGLLRSFEKPKMKHAVGIGALGLFGSVLSHTLLGYATTLFLIVGIPVFWCIRWGMKQLNTKAFIAHLGIVFWGLAASSFFWLPAITEMGFTSVAREVSATANFHDHFVCTIQLWSSAWGFGGSAPGCANDGLSFMLGKLQLVLAGIGLLGGIFISRKSARRDYMVFGAICALLGIFLTLPISTPVWELLPKFAYIQYPWRFLTLAAFGLSLLAAGVVNLVTDLNGRIACAGIVIAIAIAFNAKWFTPQYLYMKDSREFETPYDLRWRASRISDEYLPPDIVRPAESSRVVSATIVPHAGLTVSPLYETAAGSRYVVQATDTAEIALNKAYFPGWRYRVNDTDVRPSIKEGLPHITVSAGQSVVGLRFTDTPIRTLANTLSVTAIVVGLIAYGRKKQTHR